MSQTPVNGGPDWAVIGAAVATLAGIVGAVAAAMRGAFASNGGRASELERRADRDKSATANAALTLESVFRLVNELQDERDRKAVEITSIEERWVIRTKVLEDKVSFLETKIGQLEHEIRTLRL